MPNFSDPELVRELAQGINNVLVGHRIVQAGEATLLAASVLLAKALDRADDIAFVDGVYEEFGLIVQKHLKRGMQ